MKFSRTQGTLAAMAAFSIIFSCGKKKDDNSQEQPQSIEDLKLSSALSISLPSALVTAAGGSSSSSLALANTLEGAKSSEACRTMENTNMVLKRLDEVGSMMCHIEAESSRMKFGTKYAVTVKSPEGTQSLSIWVDNSNPSSLKLYQCKSGVLTQAITIDGYAGTGKAKGSIQATHQGTEGSTTHTGGGDLTFDFTQSGVRVVKASMSDTASGGSFSGSFRNYSELNLVENGVNTIKMSNIGTRGSDTMNDQGIVKFNGTLGQALFKGTGSSEGHTYDWTTRSTFNSSGVTVKNETATTDIVSAKTELPAALASDFSPTAPSGWDCSGTTESITVDMTDSTAASSAAHMACNKRDKPSFSQCFGPSFEKGTPE